LVEEASQQALLFSISSEVIPFFALILPLRAREQPLGAGILQKPVE